ncbi:unnamed protein product [Brassica oleracea var. botrytis]
MNQLSKELFCLTKIAQSLSLLSTSSMGLASFFSFFFFLRGLPKYNGCCIYISTPQKKDYFLCAGDSRCTQSLGYNLTCDAASSKSTQRGC